MKKIEEFKEKKLIKRVKNNMENKYLTIKDSDGILRPLAVLWDGGKNRKYYQPEIDKYMKRAKKGGEKLVEVEITEIKKCK